MSSRDRLVEAAFALFEEQGYDATTVEAIVERAGVSRATFFRTFRSKEEVIFPRHEEVLGRIEARLATGSAATMGLALTEASRLVLEQYLEEGELAHIRYRLTRTVPALRDRERASMADYQRRFREALRGWMPPGADADLHAELLAGAVVTAHNAVLRRWLRGTSADPRAEHDDAMAAVLAMTRVWGEPDGPAAPARVVVLRSDLPDDVLLARLDAALAGEPRPPSE
ncbi:TetR/AcrR family transcriptional regulator [Nocardioides sp.]|uniref:TetR/AcrR family transcriptional regulator n=1 Tax=Nocardioides sp. TaxID=35761 RepID=UPI00351516FA